MNEKTGKAILLAIQKEAEAQAFYKAASARARNPLVRRRLLGLAEDEAQHESTLARLYWSQTGKEPGQPSTSPPAPPPEVESLGMEALLRMALVAEDESAATYERMTRDTTDPRVKGFLEYLVDLEKGHARALADELAHLEKHPGWPGMSDTGEPER